MHARLVCRRCGTALVPAWSGLRCPRLTACGRGGYVEQGGAMTLRLVGAPASDGAQA